MLNTVFRRLDNFQQHSAEEMKALEDCVSGVAEINKGEDIIRYGDKPKVVHLLLEGWACRYKITSQGKFQTLAYLIPGDLCDVHITLISKMDHSISALTPAKVAYIPHDKIGYIYDNYPRLARALFWSMLIDESTLREWIVNVGSRAADQRLAHLICELLVRSRAAGLTADHSFYLPLTQAEMGEAMGVTTIHTNRVMQKLRSEGLIKTTRKVIDISDWKGLKQFADFDPIYLHLEQAEPELARDLE